MVVRQIRVVAGLAVLSGLSLAAAQDRAVSQRDADVMKRKITAIQELRPAASRQPVRTPITENELNAYLAYDMADGLPAGIVDPASRFSARDASRRRLLSISIGCAASAIRPACSIRSTT